MNNFRRNDGENGPNAWGKKKKKAKRARIGGCSAQNGNAGRGNGRSQRDGRWLWRRRKKKRGRNKRSEAGAITNGKKKMPSGTVRFFEELFYAEKKKKSTEENDLTICVAVQVLGAKGKGDRK